MQFRYLISKINKNYFKKPMMGHLNSFSASGVWNLNKNYPKIQMPGALPGGGMFKLRFDWYISSIKEPVELFRLEYL